MISSSVTCLRFSTCLTAEYRVFTSSVRNQKFATAFRVAESEICYTARVEISQGHRQNNPGTLSASSFVHDSEALFDP